MPVIQHVERWVIMGKDQKCYQYCEKHRTALLFTSFDENVVK